MSSLPLSSIQQEFSRFCLTLSNTGTDRTYDKLAITKATLGLLAEWAEFYCAEEDQELDEAADVLFWLEVLKVRLKAFSGLPLAQESSLMLRDAVTVLPDAVEKYVRPETFRSQEKRDGDYLLIGQALVTIEEALLVATVASEEAIMQHLMAKLSARHSSLIVS
jgi:hypothetical protein